MEINYTSSGIPKIIHQVWINDTWIDPSLKRDVPEEWKKSIKEWKHNHPDWTYILWTDELVLSYLEKKWPNYIDFYKNYEYLIQRADMIRYFILYDFGGVYCDLDLYPTENIEKYLTNSSDYFVYSANNNTFTNALMISKGNSPIFLEIFKELKKPLPWWAIGKHLKVIKSTGPLMLHKSLKDTLHIYSVLPKKKFNPYSVTEDFNIYKEGTVIRTLEGNSWHSFDSTFYNFVMKYPYFFISLGILLIFMIIFGLIYYISKYKKCRESKVCIKP